MKKTISILLVLFLLFSFAITASAEEADPFAVAYWAGEDGSVTVVSVAGLVVVRSSNGAELYYLGSPPSLSLYANGHYPNYGGHYTDGQMTEEYAASISSEGLNSFVCDECGIVVFVPTPKINEDNTDQQAYTFVDDEKVFLTCELSGLQVSEFSVLQGATVVDGNFAYVTAPSIDYELIAADDNRTYYTAQCVAIDYDCYGTACISAEPLSFSDIIKGVCKGEISFSTAFNCLGKSITEAITPVTSWIYMWINEILP